MMQVEYFKGDALEKRVAKTMLDKLALLSDAHDEFYSGAFSAQPLGDVIWNLNADPIVQALSKEVYRRVFNKIHEIGEFPATFDFWLQLLTSIWIDDAVVGAAAIEFEVPAPGFLNININGFAFQEFEAAFEDGSLFVTEAGDQIIFESYQRTIPLSLFDAIVTMIEDNSLNEYNLVSEAGDQIEFQAFDAKMDQEQADLFLFQLSAYGIVTRIYLNFLTDT